ncbi:MAG: dienelactone hydrolase family protein, partial [Phycisphaerae bacterium]
MSRAFSFAVVVCLLLCGRAPAWRGHSFEQWRRISGAATRPAVTSPQAGEKDLLELLRTAGPDSPRITSAAQWQAKQARIRRVLQAFLGEPTNLAVPAPEAVVLDETPVDDHIRRHIRIRCEPDDWIPAYLLIPRSAPAGPGPVVIVLHQTVTQGKDEPAGIRGDPSMFIARELVARGWMCLVPDVIGFGERLPEGATRRLSRPGTDTRAATGPSATQPAPPQPYDNIAEFFERHPHWSVMGKMIWDVSRCIDYLETLPEVDRRRIGCIGHSHGAYGTIFAAAFDPRIAAAAASCGFTTLRTDPRPERWSHLTPLLPSLGFYVAEPAPSSSGRGDGARGTGERPGGVRS